MREWIGDPANWETLLSATTLVTCLIFAWALAGTVVSALRRYPPRRDRPFDEVAAGRKVWAIVFVLLGLVAWSIYRLYVFQTTDVALNPLSLPVEAVRVWSGLYLVWAYRPGGD